MLKHVEAVRTAEDVAREDGVSKQMVYALTAKFVDLKVNDVQLLHQLEDGNLLLKRLVADLSLDRKMLKAVIGRNDLSS